MTAGSRGVVALAVLGFVGLAGCGPVAPDDPGDVAARADGVVVGAFNFTESKILAEIYSETLRGAGADAGVLGEVASREIMEPALEQSQVDVVPEYLGTALTFLGQDPPAPGATVAEARRSLAAAFEERGVRVMEAAPGENRNEIVVTEAFAMEHSLTKISELRRVDQDVAFGGPAECLSRPLCMAGLEDVYGLSFREFRTLDTGGPATVAALTGGEVDVALLFTTNPQITEKNLVVLYDDRHLQPPENVVPVVRADAADELGPAALAAVDRVTRLLSNETLRHLNGLVEIEGMSPAGAARSWLDSEGLLEEAA
jgi:osmoprotectant transport system substrate-binding protein